MNRQSRRKNKKPTQKRWYLNKITQLNETELEEALKNLLSLREDSMPYEEAVQLLHSQGFVEIYPGVKIRLANQEQTVKEIDHLLANGGTLE